MGGAEIQSTEGKMQGDNRTMFFSVIVTIQIQQLFRTPVDNVKQVWLEDEATSAGSLKPLKNWWTNIISEGGRIGYYVNEKKLWLIIKNEALLENATNLLSDNKVNITTEGKRYLGAAISSNEFRKKYVNEKVSKLCEELKALVL